MKNIKCVIRKNLKTNDNEHLIYIRYTYNRKYILFRTEIYVNYRNWNSRIGRVRKSYNYELRNNILEQKEIELEKIILELILRNEEPTLINVKVEFYKIKNQYQDDQSKPKKQDEKKFLKDFQDFIDYKVDLGTISKETIKTYYTTLNKLQSFQQATNHTLHYNTINNEFYYKFLKYLRANGLYDNTVDKHIKNLKLFMYHSLSQEKHNNNTFQTFKRTRTKTDFVVLEQNELRKLYYEYKPKNEKYKAVRDAFILGCCTGLRFSDLTKLTTGSFVITRDENKEIIEDAGYSFIKVPVQKTSDYLLVPFNHFICEIIEEYDIENQEIKFLKHNIQNFNNIIKSVCRDAGINSIVKVARKKNKELIPVEKAKCDFVSSHTMRRTFISLLSNMTEITNIQAVSGHKDIKVLTDYIKRSERELNSIRACFNSNIFNTSSKNTNLLVQETPASTEKVRVSIVKTRVITRK
jgi:site-specific recombinase XerD